MLLDEYMARGKHFSGTVKRMDKGDIIVEVGAHRRALAAQRNDPQKKICALVTVFAP